MTASTIRVFEQSLQKQLSSLYSPSEIQEIARRLEEDVLLLSRTEVLLLDKDRQLSPSELDSLMRYLIKLAMGHPLQYVLGYADFAGHRLHIKEGVLIPRPETEELTELILRDSASRTSKRLLDIGTGSGCIAYTLTAGLPALEESFALEVSSEAIPIARENFDRLAEKTGRQVQLWKGDLFELANEAKPPHAPFDLIVSNPPYIAPEEADAMSPSVLLFEPHLALFAPEEDPIEYYSAIGCLLQQGYLAPGGQLWLELNPLYAEEVRKELLRRVGEKQAEARLITDLSGKQRFLHLIYHPHA